MKFSVILLLLTGLHVSITGFGQSVSLSEKNAGMKKVIGELRSQTKYDFIFTDAQLSHARPVTIAVRSIALKHALDIIFKTQPLTYVIDEQTVIIRERADTAKKPSDKPHPLPELISVAGTVTDERDNPLSGASVVIKRNKMGVTTSVHGLFELKAGAGSDTLLVSFVGYKQRQVPVIKDDFLTIRLEEAKSGLDAVVVQAYGQTTRRMATGDIGRVTAAEIEKQPVNDPLLSLEGRVAGVVVTPASGYEGGPIKIEIRGRNSVNSNFTTDPLYIVNGVPLTTLDVSGTYAVGNSSTNLSRGLDQTGLSFAQGQSPLYGINPADIESIEVLKDADATAIYGSRGANGVILITTKHGKTGPNQLDLSVAEGVNFVTHGWAYLKTPQFLEMRREAFRNEGVIPTVLNAPDLLIWDTTRYSDWQHLAYGGLGQNTDATASLSGGNDQTTFRVSVGYNRSTDITRKAGANQRLTASLSLRNFSTNKKLETSMDVNYAYSVLNQVDINGIETAPPNAPPVYDSAGKLNYRQWDQAGVGLPFYSLLQPYAGKTNSINAHLSISYTFLKGLKLVTTAGYNNDQSYQVRLVPLASLDLYHVPAPTGSNSFGNSRNNNWLLEPQLTYNGILGEGKLDALLGGTIQSATTDAQTTTGNGYTSDIFIHSISAAPSVSAADNYGQYKYTGAFGRVSYNWDSKYILNLNIRRDGSSRFGPGKQFGSFASVGAAWILSDETFIKGHLPTAISFLKLRGSYGTTGSDAVGDYQFLSQWGNVSPVNTPYAGVSPLIPQLQPNEEFHWQVNKKLEAALQVEFFQGRLGLDAVYYQNRCDNQLVGFPLPEFTGFTSVTANQPANVRNAGLEFNLTGTIVSSQNVNWRANFNVGINHNKLLAYPNLAQSPFRNNYVVGKSLNLLYMLHATGVDPLTGNYSYEDHNHDGAISVDYNSPPQTNADDRYIVKNQEPNFTGGFSTTLEFRRVSLSSTFTFSKQNGYNLLQGVGSRATAGSSGSISNIAQFVYDNSWHQVGQNNAKFGKFTNVAILNASVSTSDQGYSDASYIRWQNIALSYSLSPGLLKKAGMRAMSINMQAYNILVFTSYKGLDPEVQTYGSMPPSRRITLGLRCSF